MTVTYLFDTCQWFFRNEVIQFIVSMLLADFHINKIEEMIAEKKGRITIQGLDWTGLNRVMEMGQRAVLYTWL